MLDLVMDTFDLPKMTVSTVPRMPKERSSGLAKWSLSGPVADLPAGSGPFPSLPGDA
jgi:hypothetical protein